MLFAIVFAVFLLVVAVVAVGMLWLVVALLLFPELELDWERRKVRRQLKSDYYPADHEVLAAQIAAKVALQRRIEQMGREVAAAKSTQLEECDEF